jgi:hypothetical protein
LSRRREVLRGEKVPAAVGTVANRLVEGDVAALDGQGSVLVANRAESAAVGAGLLDPQGLGLLLKASAQGALGQPGRGGSSDLLHRHQVDVGTWASLAEGTAGDDFSPPGGQVFDLLELLSRGGALRHNQSSLVLTSFYPGVFLLPCYHTPLSLAKCVLTSRIAISRFDLASSPPQCYPSLFPK